MNFRMSLPILLSTPLPQRLLQVGDQIIGILKSYRGAEQILRRFGGRTFDRSTVLDEAVRTTEARARVNSRTRRATAIAASRPPRTWKDNIPP